MSMGEDKGRVKEVKDAITSRSGQVRYAIPLAGTIERKRGSCHTFCP